MGLPREGVGAKKFGPLKSRETKLFGGISRDFLGVPDKFEKQKFVFNSRPLVMQVFMLQVQSMLGWVVVGVKLWWIIKANLLGAGWVFSRTLKST